MNFDEVEQDIQRAAIALCFETPRGVMQTFVREGKSPSDAYLIVSAAAVLTGDLIEEPIPESA